MKHKSVLTVGLILVMMLIVALAAPVSARSYPDLIQLPDGFRPEGIVVGRGHTAYAGSLADGDIYAVDLRTGAGSVLIQGPGTPAVGLDYDRRSGYLFVSGGLNGDGRVYDAANGTLVAAFAFGGGFVNDVIVTRDAAYFTDSFAPVLYKVPLGPAGALAGPFSMLPLGGDFVFVPGPFVFNTNGIVPTSNGDRLIIVNSTRGELYLVNPMSGNAELIDLNGDDVRNGDGLVLIGHTLYVVQNQLNQIAKLRLSGDYTSATLVQTITDSDFDIPTTADNHGAWLYAVNARFNTVPNPNTATYDIVKVKR